MSAGNSASSIPSPWTPLFELVIGETDQEKATFLDQSILMMASDILVLHPMPSPEQATRAMTFLTGARITTYHETGSLSEPISPQEDVTATENALAALFRPHHRSYTPLQQPRNPRASPRYEPLVSEFLRRNPGIDQARAEHAAADAIQRRATRLAWALALFHTLRDASAHTKVNLAGVQPYGVYERLLTRQGFVFLAASKVIVPTSRLKHQALSGNVHTRLAEALSTMPLLNESGQAEPTPTPDDALKALDAYLDDPRAINVALQTARMAALAAVLATQGQEGNDVWSMILQRAGVDMRLDFRILADTPPA